MTFKRWNYIKNILFPCLFFSVITGVFTGGVIFLFKLVSTYIIGLSGELYAFVRNEPFYLPLMLTAAGVLGLLSALILKLAPNCRGGGIPTSVALLRGLIRFDWIKSLFLLFISANLSYLGGVPLGNEGPSVQMGTAVGRGTVSVFAKRHRAWDRYIMTGGACAGFAAATGAPLSGIFFAFEEAHRRFTPMIFMVASMTVVAGTVTSRILCTLAEIPVTMFDLSVSQVMPTKLLWTALLVGLVCGVVAILFTKGYRAVGTLLKGKLERLPFTVKVIAVFVLVAIIGFAADAAIGSGHHLTESLLQGNGVWYWLLIIFCVRAILLIFANQIGVSGGLFVPTLSFGAILGAVCAKSLIALGAPITPYYMILVIIGMVAFLGAASRTPLMAIAFSLEALCGLSNILPITLGVTVAYLVIEVMGVPAFSDTVIETKVEQEHQGKPAQIINTYLTVGDDAFVVGKEIRDILWPPTCVVLSIDKRHEHGHGGYGIGAGDVLHIHYQTHDPKQTLAELEALVGEQKNNVQFHMHLGDESHQVPET